MRQFWTFQAYKVSEFDFSLLTFAIRKNNAAFKRTVMDVFTNLKVIQV